MVLNKYCEGIPLPLFFIFSKDLFCIRCEIFNLLFQWIWVAVLENVIFVSTKWNDDNPCVLYSPVHHASGASKTDVARIVLLHVQLYYCTYLLDWIAALRKTELQYFSE